MLNHLTAAWRLRRVLLIGGSDAQTLCTQALLTALGARPDLLPLDAPLPALNRALCAGRVSAVILPCLHALSGSLTDRLHALHLILGETREAGVPLRILCAHEDVYAPHEAQLCAQETAPLGGRTQEGLFQSILQLYADGFSRGLLGDAAPSILLRHPPCLGGGHESAAQYSAWCRAILGDETPVVEHPGAQGTFVHPLDAALAALCLGAGALLGKSRCTGCFNAAPAAHNLCANRTAFAMLARSEGFTRAPAETHPPRRAAYTPLSGEKLRRICGFSPLLSAGVALSFLMEHERALAVGEDAARIKRLEQAEAVLSMLA